MEKLNLILFSKEILFTKGTDMKTMCDFFFYFDIHLKNNRLGLVIARKCNDRREHHVYLIMQYQGDFS